MKNFVLNTPVYSSGMHKWASLRENLSSGFPTSQDSNRPTQLRRPASLEILDLASVGIIPSK